MKKISIEEIITIINSNVDNLELLCEQVEVDLSELGMDSISFIKIIVALEEYFDCEIPDSKLLVSELSSAKKIYEELCSLYNEMEKNSTHE